MYRHHHRRQHDGSRPGRLSGDGARGQLLRLQEPLLRRDEEVVPGHLQELGQLQCQSRATRTISMLSVEFTSFSSVQCQIINIITNDVFFYCTLIL